MLCLPGRNTAPFTIFHIHINCFGCSLSMTFWGVFCSTQRFLFANCKKTTKLVGYVAVCHNPRRQRFTSIAREVLSLRTHCCQQGVWPKIELLNILPTIWFVKHQQGQPSNWSSSFIIHFTITITSDFTRSSSPKSPWSTYCACVFSVGHPKKTRQQTTQSLYHSCWSPHSTKPKTSGHFPSFLSYPP